jgi:NADPH2:quinone reductase
VSRGTYQVTPDPPFALGFETAGTVVAAGAEVTTHRVGDRVVSLGVGGAFAERRVVKADWTFPLPEAMSFEEAASWFVPYTTAHHALIDRGYIVKGETLLVLGASGGVGQAAVALGRVLGARIIAATSTEEKAAAARGLGAHHIIRYDGEPLSQRVLELTDGRGADVVFDPVGGDHFRDAVRGTAFLGRVLVVGFASGSVPSISLNLALVKGISLIGVDTARYIRECPGLAAEAHTELTELWSEELLDNLTTRVVDLDDLPGIHTSFTDRAVIGKWVVRVSRGGENP